MWHSLSVASNLISGVTGQQIYRKDLITGEVKLVSCDAAGAQGNNVSQSLAMSYDGRYVVFYSAATNLVTPATTGQQIFRKDLLTGEVKLVSCDASGVPGNSASAYPCISSDGRYVAFVSIATNLIPGVSGARFTARIW